MKKKLSFFHDGKGKQKRFLYLLQSISILYWLLVLRNSDSYYMPYLLVGIGGIFSFYFNIRERREIERNKNSIVIFASAVLFAVICVSANYWMFLNKNLPENAEPLFSFLYQKLSVILILVGGFFVFWNLLIFLMDRLRDFCWKRDLRCRRPPAFVYVGSLFIISGVNISVLFTGYYPGKLTPDSVSIIKQGLEGWFSNHHPYYYTKIVQFFVKNGVNWFGDINLSVALFHVFQIIFMASCISYAIVTMYQMKISLKWIVGCFIWYVAMPFHIRYSFTMWKDVMFGGFVAVFIVAAFRIMKCVGRSAVLNYLMLIAGSMGTCLFRSNGWFSFLLTFLCFIILFGEHADKKRLRSIFLGVIIVTFILKHPVLKLLNVPQPDLLESLSIPTQQIARILRDCDDVSEEHKELLGRIVDIDQIPEVYKPYITDPVKDLVRQEGNLQYLTEHKMMYLQLYAEMSLSHLGKSMEAWVDITKGYWNGGYAYGTWRSWVQENDLGLQSTIYVQNVRQIMDEYFWIYTDHAILQIFLCIGFYVWLIWILAVLCMVRRDKEGFFLTVPLISIVISLLISSPVYAEFRYAYAIFCCIPFLISAAFFKKSTMNAVNSCEPEVIE